ncbi:MAG: hypothetical protein Q9160_004493 [Pyrenula sp. 1 TL-2023]
MGLDEKTDSKNDKKKEENTKSFQADCDKTSERAQSHRRKHKQEDTVLNVRISAFLAFAMCWPTKLEIRKGEAEPRHCDPGGVYVVRRRAGARHQPGKACTVPVPATVSEKSPQKPKCSSPPPSASPVNDHTEQHLHEHLQKEEKEEVKIEERIEAKETDNKTKGLELKLDVTKTQTISPEDEHRSRKIRELEVELKIIRGTMKRDDDLFTIPECSEVSSVSSVSSVKQRPSYRISVPGRYFGEVVYVGNDEVDYVYRSPRVKFEV